MTTLRYAMPEGEELSLHLTHSPFGTHASSLWFSEDANVLAETGSIMYMDYCLPCIAERELYRMGAPDSLQEQFRDWHPCECEDDA